MNAWWHTVLRRLHIEKAQDRHLQIQEQFTFTDNAAVNRIWYRGEPEELKHLYRQLDGCGFWKMAAQPDSEISCIHTGLPQEIVNTLSQLITADMLGVECDGNAAQEDVLNEILEENLFSETLESTVGDTLVIGDGAFRLTFDPDVSGLPIIDFVPGDRTEFLTQSGRITDVIFHTRYEKGGKVYIFRERYGYGYVRYALTDAYGNQVPLSTLAETSRLEDLTLDENIRLAVPLMFRRSKRYRGRGQSIYDAKRGNFDALDEAWSQFMQAVRKSQATDYIPASMLPYDPNTGQAKKPNSFLRTFLMTSGIASENGKDQIQTTQPQIQFDGYLSSYMTALDLCLQGLISPSTLGIDVKKLDNAEAQREKEKATLYTRNHIISVLQKTLPEVFHAALWMYAALYKLPMPERLDISVPFGEYANPSFESQVETVGKAKTARIMSNEALVDELYGDTKTEQWKAEEIARLNAMDGLPDASDEVDF